MRYDSAAFDCVIIQTWLDLTSYHKSQNKRWKKILWACNVKDVGSIKDGTMKGFSDMISMFGRSAPRFDVDDPAALAHLEEKGFAALLQVRHRKTTCARLCKQFNFLQHPSASDLRQFLGMYWTKRRCRLQRISSGNIWSSLPTQSAETTLWRHSAFRSWFLGSWRMESSWINGIWLPRWQKHNWPGQDDNGIINSGGIGQSDRASVLWPTVL